MNFDLLILYPSVPNYLRTKLSLDLERKQRERWEEAEKEGVATAEKIKSFNQTLSSALDRVNELKEEVEERRTRTGICGEHFLRGGGAGLYTGGLHP